MRDLVRDHRLDRRAASARLFGLTRSYWRLGAGCRTSKSFFPLAADAAGAEVKLLRRRQSEPEPVDREEAREEWADLLRRYRTRSSPEMRRELYHAQARKRQKARTAATTPTPTKGRSQSRFTETPVATAPQPRPETVPTAATSKTVLEVPTTEAPLSLSRSHQQSPPRDPRQRRRMSGPTSISWPSRSCVATRIALSSGSKRPAPTSPKKLSRSTSGDQVQPPPAHRLILGVKGDSASWWRRRR